MRNFSTEGVHFRKLLHPLFAPKMHPLEILLKLGLFAKRVLDEHLFLQRRLRREVFALIHNRKALSWK